MAFDNAFDNKKVFPYYINRIYLPITFTCTDKYNKLITLKHSASVFTTYPCASKQQVLRNGSYDDVMFIQLECQINYYDGASSRFSRHVVFFTINEFPTKRYIFQ